VKRDGTISWRELLAETAPLVGDHNEARWLCEQAAGERGAEWLAMLDAPATVRSVAHLDAMVARRCGGEPLAYVLGSWAFRTIELMVDGRVLIPRADTEVVAAYAIDAARVRLGRAPTRIVDLGTGSGAIGLSVAAELPLDTHEVWCTDMSIDALDVCRANLAGLGRAGTSVRLAHGSWFEALPRELVGAVDVVVSNPPYVTTNDPDLADSVREWEPMSALFAGDDGLDAYRSILGDVIRWLAPCGALVFEIGSRQGDAVRELCTHAGLHDVAVHKDFAGLDRVVTATAPV
jgi:release factor glutamine methyltransferase